MAADPFQPISSQGFGPAWLKSDLARRPKLLTPIALWPDPAWPAASPQAPVPARHANIQAEPFEVFQSLASGIVACSGQVQILHPKDNLAMVTAGNQPGQKKGAGIAQMEPSCGRWGEPADGL